VTWYRRDSSEVSGPAGDLDEVGESVDAEELNPWSPSRRRRPCWRSGWRWSSYSDCGAERPENGAQAQMRHGSGLGSLRS
jgi:hypothetical protein